jgi:hypothetical protein
VIDCLSCALHCIYCPNDGIQQYNTSNNSSSNNNNSSSNNNNNNNNSNATTNTTKQQLITRADEASFVELALA